MFAVPSILLFSSARESLSVTYPISGKLVVCKPPFSYLPWVLSFIKPSIATSSIADNLPAFYSNCLPVRRILLSPVKRVLSNTLTDVVATKNRHAIILATLDFTLRDFYWVTTVIVLSV
jgi:hypothetical protein